MGDLSSRRGMVQSMDDVLGKDHQGRRFRPKCSAIPNDAAFSYARPRNVFDGIQNYSEAPKNVAKPLPRQRLVNFFVTQ